MSGAVETRSWLTITVPYTTRETTLTGEDAGTFTTLDGRSGLSVLRAGVEVRIWTSNIHAAVARSWPIGHGQADHAKRLAEIGEAVGERLPLSPCDGALLWEQIRAASDALAAVGIPDDGRALAERVKALAERTTPKRCDDCGGFDAPHGHRFGCGMEPENEPSTGLDVATAGDAKPMRTDGPIVQRTAVAESEDL